MTYKEYFNSKGEIIGKLIGNVYSSKRYSHSFEKDGNKYISHYYVKGKGYPVSDSILQDLKLNGCEEIKIIAIGKTKLSIFTFSIQEYLDAPVFQENGYDKQRCVSIVGRNTVIMEEHGNV